ncbi:MAG: hypothetical protein ABSH32_34080 [Bryobacteraceae bacterium]
MPNPWNVDDLEVVGYANVLKSDMLPSVVPPVFRLKSSAERALLPPYSFNAGFLCNATEAPQSELEALRDSNDITLFDHAFPARGGFELWIDRAFHWHYQPRDEAGGELSRIAAEAIENATEALRQGNLEEAERLTSVATSANDKRLEPLAIKAAIRRIQGDTAGERLMAELAATALEETFNLLVEHYYGAAARKQPTETAPAPVPRRPMQDVARLRAAA